MQTDVPVVHNHSKYSKSKQSFAVVFITRDVFEEPKSKYIVRWYGHISDDDII